MRPSWTESKLWRTNLVVTIRYLDYQERNMTLFDTERWFAGTQTLLPCPRACDWIPHTAWEKCDLPLAYTKGMRRRKATADLYVPLRDGCTAENIQGKKPDDCGRCCALATSTNERGLDGHPYILLGLLRMTDYTVHACPGPDHYLSMHHFFQQMPETRRPWPCCHTATRAVCRASRNSGAQTRMATRAPDWGSVARGLWQGQGRCARR